VLPESWLSKRDPKTSVNPAIVILSAKAHRFYAIGYQPGIKHR